MIFLLDFLWMGVIESWFSTFAFRVLKMKRGVRSTTERQNEILNLLSISLLQDPRTSRFKSYKMRFNPVVRLFEMTWLPSKTRSLEKRSTLRVAERPAELVFNILFRTEAAHGKT